MLIQGMSMNMSKMFSFAVCLFAFGVVSAAPKRNEQYQPTSPKQAVSSPNKQVRNSGNLNQPQSRK